MYQPGWRHKGAAVAIGGNDAFTKVLLHQDGASDAVGPFTDSNLGGTAHTFTAPGALCAFNTTIKKFGVSSCRHLEPNGGYIETPHHADFVLGSGDWCYDGWFNRNNFHGQKILFGQLSTISGTAANNLAGVYIDASNILQARVSVGGTYHSIAGSGAWTGTAWRHIALIRNGGTVTLCSDGAVQGSVAVSGSCPTPSLPLGIGRTGSPTIGTFIGYHDEFRLSVGTPRWTAPFTPPTGPYS